MSLKRFFIPALVVVLSLLSSPARAVPITATDYDTLSLGSLVNGPITNDILSYDLASSILIDIGDLTTSVYDNASVYTYVLEVTPEESNVSEFNTAFDVVGFNNTAGYSFFDASSVGTGFNIDHDADGTIDWMAVYGEAWDAGEKLTLFYQSSRPAYLGDYYQMINSHFGQAQGYAPSIPDATAMLLLGSACLVGGLSRFRRKFRK